MIDYLHITEDEERIVKLVKTKKEINCRLNLYGDKLVECYCASRINLDKGKHINQQDVALMKMFIDLFNKYFDMLTEFVKNEDAERKILDGRISENYRFMG